MTLARIADLTVAFAAAIGLAGAGASTWVALSSRHDSIDVTCRQVKDLREDLVDVLDTAQQLSAQRPDLTAAERARVRVFYQAQERRVGPVRCP